MGYDADGSLADLWPEDFVDRVGIDIAANVQDVWMDGVVRRTPIAQIPQAYHGDFEAWEEDRGGRPPGTLRERWEAGQIEKTKDGYRFTVTNLDPIASFVEHDTQPHLIGVKKARVLRFPAGPVFRYRPFVWHPGTQGKHMSRDTEAEVDARYGEIAQRTIDLHAAVA